MKLFEHHPHPHKLTNVNEVHADEQRAAGLNQHIAIGMTRLFQSMWMFWAIMAWIVLWIAVNATIARFDPLPWPLLLCLASVPQLPLMIVIMVGQGQMGRHQEIQAEEQFNTTQKTFEDILQIMRHLEAQDEELLRHAKILEALEEVSPKQINMLSDIIQDIRRRRR